jgi:hypothetical protein
MKYRYDNRYDYDMTEACIEYGFIASDDFWNYPDILRWNVWNGLGAAGHKWNCLIPDTVWGVNITLASLPHDVECHLATTEREWQIANLHFLFNMNRIVRNHSSTAFMRNLRYLRTHKYYMAVESEIGRRACLADK